MKSNTSDRTIKETFAEVKNGYWYAQNSATATALDVAKIVQSILKRKSIQRELERKQGSR